MQVYASVEKLAVLCSFFCHLLILCSLYLPIDEKVARLDAAASKSKAKSSSSKTLAVVIARYDYDSQVYSPNNPDEELSFKKGM